MKFFSILYRIVTDPNFRNAVLFMFEVSKGKQIQNFAASDDADITEKVEICKKDIDTLTKVVDHIKKYDSNNIDLIANVNVILNDVKEYYRTIE